MATSQIIFIQNETKQNKKSNIMFIQLHPTHNHTHITTCRQNKLNRFFPEITKHMVKQRLYGQIHQIITYLKIPSKFGKLNSNKMHPTL